MHDDVLLDETRDFEILENPESHATKITGPMKKRVVPNNN